VSIYKRPESTRYVIEIRWQGLPRLKLSTGSSSKKLAEAMQRTLHSLKDAGRLDMLRLLAEGKLRLADVYEEYVRNPAALQHRLSAIASPALGLLLDQWFAWLDDPATLSSKTRRPYAPKTTQRYKVSWARVLGLLPRGRGSALADITKGFLADFRAQRRREGAGGATINRDLCAVGAFLTWCEQEREIDVRRPALPRERESAGRERWLDAAELSQLEAALPRSWWPLFATLVYTGLRVGEAQGLCWSDIRLSDQVITVHDRGRRLKTSASARVVPIAVPLARLLAEHRTRYAGGPADHVFSHPFGSYQLAQRVFQRACREAGLHDVRIHDLRHTFGVHCAQAGIPIVRIQRLLGHSTPVMALRYMRHAPENYFAADAARVAASLSGIANREGRAQAELARQGLKGS
jgi:integrase